MKPKRPVVPLEPLEHLHSSGKYRAHQLGQRARNLPNSSDSWSFGSSLLWHPWITPYYRYVKPRLYLSRLRGGFGQCHCSGFLSDHHGHLFVGLD